MSAFDGISCGQLALLAAGIRYTKYYAIEVHKPAIKVTQHNFPNTIQLGDIKNVTGAQIGWCDLYIGGSPCQDLSRANKDITGLAGKKSILFYHYVRLYNELKEINPDIIFILENVIMSDESFNIISEKMGTYPVRINSALVSAQLRDRYYWCNFGPANFDLFGNRQSNIPLPKNRGGGITVCVDTWLYRP